MKIFYDNIVFTSAISSLSEDSFYEWDTALNDTRLTRYGRTLGVDDEWLLFTYSTATDLDYIHISNHNITSGATVKLQGNATDSWGSPTVDQTLNYNSTYDYWYYNFSSTQSYQYWRLYIDDPTNTDGYIQIAYIYMGEELVMPGMTSTQSIPYISNASVNKSLSGHTYGDRRVRLKGGGITFPIIEDTEKKDIETFFDYTDIIIPFLLMFWEDDLDIEPPLYCTLTTSLQWAKNPGNGLTWALSLEFEETR